MNIPTTKSVRFILILSLIVDLAYTIGGFAGCYQTPGNIDVTGPVSAALVLVGLYAWHRLNVLRDFVRDNNIDRNGR
jgi:hypothetical protein